MVVETLVTQRQPIQPLSNQASEVVRETGPAPGIVQGFGRHSAQAALEIHSLQEQRAAIAGDIATVKSGFDPSAFTGWKAKKTLGYSLSRAKVQFEFSVSN